MVYVFALVVSLHGVVVPEKTSYWYNIQSCTKMLSELKWANSKYTYSCEPLWVDKEILDRPIFR